MSNAGNGGWPHCNIVSRGDPSTKLGTMGFSGEGRFSRSAFGLTTWFPAVGDDVHVRIQAEFDKAPTAQAG